MAKISARLPKRPENRLRHSADPTEKASSIRFRYLRDLNKSVLEHALVNVN